MDDQDKLRNLIKSAIRNYKDFTGVRMWESSKIQTDHSFFHVMIPADCAEDLWDDFRKLAVTRYGKNGQLLNKGKGDNK